MVPLDTMLSQVGISLAESEKVSVLYFQEGFYFEENRSIEILYTGQKTTPGIHSEELLIQSY